MLTRLSAQAVLAFAVLATVILMFAVPSSIAIVGAMGGLVVAVLAVLKFVQESSSEDD